ncbi:uncharacterized protein LY89DRAFT_685523 [Mollisia scopiformis]|uniref:Uncharacterized protein n=1 Tax=Mollisia scopiformis TaxID=149040 RepID=A0A194XA05_MOLSC|nr:uncharacterized protein LY89DRAFT_685523 [Mollisia scopiformis]KUJ16602.1 hypothetical protein LY89DRAFT_685523 [Mollisia scopiformis]
MSDWNMKVVWPKDGPMGRRKRGFFRGLNDIRKGKGPDMFVQQGRANTQPISPDRWTNWDSYHDVGSHFNEAQQHNGFRSTSRGLKRYDPVTRKYRTWEMPMDWFQVGVHGLGIGINGDGFPRFTESERININNRRNRGLPRVDPNHRNMGGDWDDFGPKRFRGEHDHFWENAHRIGEITRLAMGGPLPPLLQQILGRPMQMHQNYHYEPDLWAL